VCAQGLVVVVVVVLVQVGSKVKLLSRLESMCSSLGKTAVRCRSLLPHSRSLFPHSRSLLPHSRSLLPHSRSLLPILQVVRFT